MLALQVRTYLIQCYGSGDLCYREVITKFNEKYPKTTIYFSGGRPKISKKICGNILNVKKIRKHLDENDAAFILVFHSVEENPQMSLRNRAALQTGIEFIIIYYLIGFANNKQTRFHKSKPIFLKFCMER
jgi:hypothetical protein